MAGIEREGDRLTQELEGLDTLELPPEARAAGAASAWSALWPKLTAVLIILATWQAIVLAALRPEYLLPSPLTTAQRLLEEIGAPETEAAIVVTLQRAALGFLLAIVIGTTLGAAVAQVRWLRSAIGSLITGLQTMPSIAWFPLAILVLGLSEEAILFVVVLGASPSVANGLIAGVDAVPPILLRVGHVLGARGLAMWRHVILPAALPAFVAGLKQGWAFAWRSLMAGEILVLLPGRPSLGSRLEFARELSDAPYLLAVMVLILAAGIAVDGLVFASIERGIRARRGLTGLRMS